MTFVIRTTNKGTMEIIKRSDCAIKKQSDKSFETLRVVTAIALVPSEVSGSFNHADVALLSFELVVLCCRD